MKLYPVGLGKHENVYYIAKEKNLFTFKIMIRFKDEKAFIVNASTPNPQIRKYIDLNKVYDEISSKLSKYDYVLETKAEDLFNPINNTPDHKISLYL